MKIWSQVQWIKVTIKVYQFQKFWHPGKIAALKPIMSEFVPD